MKALIGYDGTPGAEIAIDLAASLPWPDGSTLRVVTAIDPTKFETIYFPVGPQNLQQLVENEMLMDGQRAATAAQRLERAGLCVEHAVSVGRPSRVLAAEASTFGADLIIVGSRGHGGVMTAVAGSVSAETIDATTVPVLVARSPSVHRVLAADDGSDGAAQAINCLIRWPVLDAVAVDVLSVVPNMGRWGFHPTETTAEPIDDPTRTSPERLRHFQIANRAAHRLQACGHPADWIVSAGAAATEIVHTAEDQHADLIVMGTRGHTGIERLVTGSVSRRVVTHADCSVMVVRPPSLN
jgi:nucleotide-binding universal stress UspA family protein